MTRFGIAALLACATLGTLAPGKIWAGGVESLNGHLSIGYARLFTSGAPGGSFSIVGGVDRSITSDLRGGVGVGFHLLGSRNFVRGSLFATVDYSLFEAVLFAHWIPSRLGPVGRISVGPALLGARAELSASGGGARFVDLEVQEFAPGVALDVTLIRRASSPVRVGMELGGRAAFMEPEDWSVGSARVTFHY